MTTDDTPPSPSIIDWVFVLGFAFLGFAVCVAVLALSARISDEMAASLHPILLGSSATHLILIVGAIGTMIVGYAAGLAINERGDGEDP